MTNLPLGTIVLIIVSLLVYFGVAHRILDRMRLTDKGALAVIAAIIVGSFMTIPILRGEQIIELNVGGAVVPVGLAIYVLSKAGTSKEIIRAIGAAIVAAVAIIFSSAFLGGTEPETLIMEPLYFYPLIGGIVAYLVSRSRRSAFISGTLGILFADLYLMVRILVLDLPGTVSLGGAGAFDSTIIAGIIAALLAEIIGETRERLQGGPATKGRPKELLNGLKNLEFTSMFAAKLKKPETKDDRREENEE